MRAFTKAAALLSLTPALAFVIPDLPGLSTPPSNSVVEYHSSDPSLELDINGPDVKERYPTLEFHVQGTSKACGESDIHLNGLKLDTEWEGTSGHGREYLDINGGREAQWHITCLFDVLPSDRSNSDGGDVVHVLSLYFSSSLETVPGGFTVSYKQIDHPAILRFEPRYHSMDFANGDGVVKLWRTPSLQFETDFLKKGQKSVASTPSGFIGQAQKSLGTYLQSLRGTLKKEVQEIIENFCPKHRASAESNSPKMESSDDYHSNKISTSSQPSSIPSIDEIFTKTELAESTTTSTNLVAAQTRSLTASQTLEAPDLPTSQPPQGHTDNRLHLLKLFALALVLCSCFSWICLRCRDPRCRAECLARREERRNRKLYRRAARHHKVRMWFWNLRMKYGLASNEILTVVEKNMRVDQQENILEDFMANDIRALRNAHRVVSNITAAEEGRNSFMYDIRGSERPPSVTSLPGYESEGSQPPTYDDVGGSLEGTTVVDGFQYIPTDTEFKSDSSVISTSPRMSRDGTNSDFDEKIEPYFLERAEPAGSGG